MKDKKGMIFGLLMGIVLFAIVGYFIATLWATGSLTGKCISDSALDLSGFCNAIKWAGVIIGGIIGFIIGKFVLL